MTTDESTNVLRLMVGMSVIECSIDINNNDLVLKLNRASFAFFCEYELVPKSACFADLTGAVLQQIDNSFKTMFFNFDSGLSIHFSWENCKSVEAFAGTIETTGDQKLWVSEEA